MVETCRVVQIKYQNKVTSSCIPIYMLWSCTNLHFYLGKSLACFLFTFECQYLSPGLLCKCPTLGKSLTSQWTLTRKIHRSGLEVDQQETRLNKHAAFHTTHAARVLNHFRSTYRSRFQCCGIQNRGH
jgi:hypothetical protein